MTSHGGSRRSPITLPSVSELSRRTLLLGGLLAASRAFAFGDPTEVSVAELQLKEGTTSRPEAWTRLLLELIQTTSVEAVPRATQLSPEDPALFAHPFAVIVGSGPLPRLSEKAQEQLVRYLSYGGFLLIDDASNSDAFDASVRNLVAQLFPTRPIGVLPSDHSIYRSFFLLHSGPVGRSARHGVVEGVQLGSMHPLLYFRDDLSGALDRYPDGTDRNPCSPGGESQRREAIKLGINLLMYALTSNYKQDQVHVRQLILEGRLE